jgi:hypothetical protein
MGKRSIAQTHRTGNTHIYGIPPGGALAYSRCYLGGRGACKAIVCREVLATWHARADCPGALSLAHKGGGAMRRPRVARGPRGRQTAMNHNNFGAKAARGSPLGSVAYSWFLRDTTRAANRPETGRNFDTDKHGGRCPDLTKKPISLWRAQRGQSGLRSIRTSKWDALTESGVLEPRGGPSRPRCLVRIKSGHAVRTPFRSRWLGLGRGLIPMESAQDKLF